MKLLDILHMIMCDYDDTLKNQNKTKDCRPETVFTITLCYMAEEETWVTLPINHPLLTYVFDIEIVSFSPNENTLQCWVSEKDWYENLRGEK